MKKGALLFLSFIFHISVLAQTGIGTTLPNANAVLDVKSMDKGLLIPRVTLKATDDFSPLSSHVEGMLIYNTATDGTSPVNVTPGFYYNNGTKWIRVDDATEGDKTKDAWVDDNANTQILLGTLSNGNTARPTGTAFVAKDNGNVGIGLTNPMGILDIKGKIYVNNKQTIYNADALNGTNFIGSFIVGNGGTSLSHSAGDEGRYNTGVGGDVLTATTTGNANTAIGYFALKNNTTGINNTATGVTSLWYNTTGNWNTANGAAALRGNTTGNYNTALGGYSMVNNLPGNMTGSYNSAVGYRSLNKITTGSYNTVLGSVDANDGESRITTGSNNTYVGYSTGAGITTGSGNSILGANVGGLTAALTNNIILADGTGIQRLRILSDGKTGIGTTTPQKQLHVNGALQITNELNVGGSATTAGSAGTTGQLLVSRGAAAAPTWNNTNSISGISRIVVNNEGTTSQTFAAASGETSSGNIEVFLGTQKFNNNTAAFSFDASDNAITIQQAGLYQVNVFIGFSGLSNFEGDVLCSLRKNGTIYKRFVISRSNNSVPYTIGSGIGGSIVSTDSYNASDKIEITVSRIGTETVSTFSGSVNLSFVKIE